MDEQSKYINELYDKYKVNSVNRIGGARIGWLNATWPLASLTVTRDSLELSATLLGKYSFSPQEVVSIEKFTHIPVLGWGIKINHIVDEYPEKIVFWCFGNPENLVREIREVGFIGTAPKEQARESRGFPVRWQAIVVIVLLWNALLLLDQKLYVHESREPGPLSVLALFLLFICSAGMYGSESLRSLILKPGRDIGEINQWLRFMTFLSGIMFVGFAVSYMFR